jgi:hypothetical protein
MSLIPAWCKQLSIHANRLHMLCITGRQYVLNVISYAIMYITIKEVNTLQITDIKIDIFS